MQYYSHFMAVMMATGYLNFQEEELGRELTEYYRIMLSYYGTNLAPLQLPQKAVHRDAACCRDLPVAY